MGKLSVALERGVIIAAAVSTVSASAQSVAPASKYPVKLAGGFQVHRGSEPGAESCIVYGLRAMPTAGEKTGPLFVSAKVIWDAVRCAARTAGIDKHVSPHTLRSVSA